MRYIKQEVLINALWRSKVFYLATHNRPAHLQTKTIPSTHAAERCIFKHLYPTQLTHQISSSEPAVL